MPAGLLLSDFASCYSSIITILENDLNMIKHYLVSNSIGRTLFALRDKYEIVHKALFWPDEVGTIANDQLATKFVTAMCKPNATFIDVGAHIGSIIGKVQHLLPAAKIIAVEAIPQKVVHLKKRFPLIDIHNCAVGESTAEAVFYVNRTRSGYSSLLSPQKNTKDSIEEIRVTIRKLDDLVAADDVDVIKIDVEGAELSVLRGATAIIARCRPVIMFESAPSHDGSSADKEALYQFFAEIDYALVIPCRLAHSSTGMTLGGFIDCHAYPRVSTNFFAVPVERAEEVKQNSYQLLN